MSPLNCRRKFLMLGLLAALLVPALPAAGADEAERQTIVGPDNEIYGTTQAAELVAEARKHDPMFCPLEQADRDRAALLYEKAIAAQPGAKLNGPLADRIAQMYAFYENKEQKVSPVRGKAVQWWHRCADLASPGQLLWAQAQMGLASMAVIAGDHQAALRICNRVLGMSAAKAQLPDWKLWPDANSERGAAALEQEQARLRESFEGLQADAARMQVYTLAHVSRPVALDALQNIASRHKGTKAGDWASNQMAEIQKAARKDPWALPDLATASMPAAAPRSPLPLEHGLSQATVVDDSPAPTPAETATANYWPLGIAASAIIGAALAAAGIMWIRHRNRLP